MDKSPSIERRLGTTMIVSSATRSWGLSSELRVMVSTESCRVLKETPKDQGGKLVAEIARCSRTNGEQSMRESSKRQRTKKDNAPLLSLFLRRRRSFVAGRG